MRAKEEAEAKARAVEAFSAAVLVCEDLRPGCPFWGALGHLGLGCDAGSAAWIFWGKLRFPIFCDFPQIYKKSSIKLYINT